MKLAIKFIIIICIFTGAAAILNNFTFAHRLLHAGTFQISIGLILAIITTFVTYRMIKV